MYYGGCHLLTGKTFYKEEDSCWLKTKGWPQSALDFSILLNNA